MLLLFVAVAELVVLLFILLLPCGFVYGFWLVQNWRFRSLHYTVHTHIWIFRRIGSIETESKQRRNREEIGGVWIQLNCSCRCYYSISNFTKCWWIQSRFFRLKRKKERKWFCSVKNTSDEKSDKLDLSGFSSQWLLFVFGFQFLNYRCFQSQSHKEMVWNWTHFLE